MSTSLVNATAPVSDRVRAYFAPVDRTLSLPTLFDPSQAGAFALDMPPAPWIDLGWISNFARTSETKVAPLSSGAPSIVHTQVRTQVEALVAFSFESWGKLQLAVAAGSEQMNILVGAAAGPANGSGGVAATAVPLVIADSNATNLAVGAASSNFSAGELVAVDIDYTGQLGYVGSGVSAAYVTSPAAVGADVNYVRRVTLNVGRVVSVAADVLTLGAPLLAGPPAAGMQVSPLTGFCDREGGRFFQEWSALFVVYGEQGDRIFYHYPRLQAMRGSSEISTPLFGTAADIAAPFKRTELVAAFRALPVVDANDSAAVVCFRSYIPGLMFSV